MNDRTQKWLAVIVVALTGAWFLSSRLIFAPVPWPDGSAFYLPSLDLFSWPPRWVMHNQAAFVPSYDRFNFNIMPAFTVYLGLGTLLGLKFLLGSVVAIKALSLLPVLLWSWAIWRWLSRERIAPWISAAVGLSALWDPTVRWGALAVRTEPWIGLLWALILMELLLLAPTGVRASGRSLWRISFFLGLAAWFHYEAVYLVPGLALGLAGSSTGNPQWVREWRARLLGVAWRTLVVLSPWILFALIHAGLFYEQMEIAFHRLGHFNRYAENPYLLFHSLFLWLGSPVGTPKFFNLGKAIFWALSAALTVRSLILSTRPGGFVRLGAAVTYWMGLYLWWSKPEVWYTTVCHVTFWPWVALELVLQRRFPEAAVPWRTLPIASASFAALSLAATFGQQLRIPPYYHWSNYRAWVDCIERQTEAAVTPSGDPRESRAKLRVWQPHYPDALVELSDRHPDYDLTRALDFKARRDLAIDFGRRVDVILFTRFFNLSRADERVTWGADPKAPAYEGPERPEDLRLLTQNDYESPFGPWAARELEAQEPGARERSVCQVGPFWAEILRKK